MFDTSKAMVAAAVAALLAGALALPAPAVAQEPTTVTGCLSKGPDEGTFSITGEDGKAYRLSSTSVGGLPLPSPRTVERQRVTRAD